MKIVELIRNVKIKRVVNDDQVDIHAIQFDSRLVVKDDVFVATRGTAVDGHSFIPKAIEQGAVAIVCEDLPSIQEGVTYILVEDSLDALGVMAANFYDNPSRKLTLVGVTGTNEIGRAHV